MSFPFENDILLENERALVRAMQPEDAVSLLEAATADRDLIKYSAIKIYTPELLQDYVLSSIAEREQKQRYPFTIFDKQANANAGSTSMAKVSNESRRLEIGWTWIGKRFQGTGLNAEVKELMLDYIFKTLEFERVEFLADERNLPSRRALEKLGAVQEGILRSHMLLNDGFRRNSVVYSILKNEWLERERSK